MKLPYYKKSLLVPNWKLQPEPAHCVPVDVEEFYMRTDAPPPPLRDQPPPPTAPPKPKEEAKSPIEVLLDMAIRAQDATTSFQRWVNSPTPPKPVPAPTPPPKNKPHVELFDLQDIVGAMRRVDWPMSEKVMRKWFAGSLNYVNTDNGAKNGVNQDGKPFPPSMIDTTMFKLDWILQFPRAQEALGELRDIKIYNQAAEDEIKKMFRKQGNPTPYFRDALKLSGGDVHRLHHNFQFQLVGVDTSLTDKFFMGMRGAVRPNGVFMDDLYGSLGAFAFYAAVGEHRFYPLRKNRGRVEVESVILYMRDVFTFHDRAESYLGGLLKSGSQYLGHWNRTGFVLVPGAAAVSEVNKGDWPMWPVAREGAIRKDEIYYPVRNKDFRAWQLKHKQGGDLILYSDLKWLKLTKPIVCEVDL